VLNGVDVESKVIWYDMFVIEPGRVPAKAVEGNNNYVRKGFGNRRKT
jgi:hypothetical protein